MLTMPGAEVKLLFAAEGEVCTGSSTVDVFALGSEEVCGLWASLVSGGSGGLSTGEPSKLVWDNVVAVICEGLSTRSKRCIFFST
jgi:hypothetical protein